MRPFLLFPLAVLLLIPPNPVWCDTPAVSTRWIDPRCVPLECTKNGPFVQSDDGSLYCIEKRQLHVSSDSGKTWQMVGNPIDSDIRLEHAGHVGQFVRTRAGTIVVVYLNFDGYRFEWNDEENKPRPGCRLELWAIRSDDGGRTWNDNQQLLEGYNADFMGLFQTSEGRLVATVEHLDVELKRWVVCSFVSDDEGKTWLNSNWIDLGGHGHHDGAVEPAATQLSDGRLMMLIRTNLDQFWRAYSSDGGRYWRVIEPSGIDASSAPGWLLKLRSGRLALAWNRLDSQRKGKWPKSEHRSASEFPASWHREELSIAFSDDQGQSWSDPQMIAYDEGGQLAYPYMLERSPGHLWVFTRYTFGPDGKAKPPLAVSVTETDFR
jgi:hypothetical protein